MNNLKHPLIDKAQKDGQFKIPDSYFENFSMEIREKISTEKKPFQLFTFSKLSLVGYSLIVLALLSIGFLLQFQNTKSTEEITILDQDIENYFLNEISTDFSGESYELISQAINPKNYLIDDLDIINYLKEDKDFTTEDIIN